MVAYLGKELVGDQQSCQSRRCEWHIIRYKKVWVVELPTTLDGSAYKGWQKIKGDLHPDGLVSTLKPLEEVIVPSPSESGWAQWSLLPDEI
eukprot:88768-Ditylum_brightwellii.AAC.1